MSKFTLVIFFLVLCIVGVSSKAALAAEQKLSVSGPVTIFARFLEEATLHLKFKREAKASYYQYLIEKRLAELEWIIENKKFDFVEDASSRYATFLGKFTHYIIANKMRDQKEPVLNMLSRHKEVITKLQENFQFESGWWLLLQHDINSTQIFADKLKEI